MLSQSRSAKLFEKWVIELARERPAADLLYAARGTGRRRMGKHVRSLHTHTNPAHEFVYAIKGQASIVTPKQVFSLSPGELLLIEPGVEHGELPSDPPRPYHLFWCALELSYGVLCPTTYRPSTGWRAGTFMELTGRTDVQSIATAIGTEMASRTWGWEEATHGLLRYLVCILVRRIRRGSIVRIPRGESPTIARDPPGLAGDPCRATVLPRQLPPQPSSRRGGGRDRHRRPHHYRADGDQAAVPHLAASSGGLPAGVELADRCDAARHHFHLAGEAVPASVRRTSRAPHRPSAVPGADRGRCPHQHGVADRPRPHQRIAGSHTIDIPDVAALDNRSRALLAEIL